MTRLPDDVGRSDSEEIGRRRKQRNWAVLVVLVGLVALFYAITFVRMGH